MAVFFNGRLMVTPAVATKIDDTGMANRNLSVPMNLAIIGRADSGAPKKVIAIGNPIEAADYFKGGELLKAIEKAFSPSSMTGSPQTIYAVRVDPATQARLVLPQDVAAEAGALQTYSGENPAREVKLASGAAGGTDGYYNGYMIRMTSGVATGETNLITGYTPVTKIATLRYQWKNAPAEGDAYEIIRAAMALESLDYGINANRIKVKLQTGTAAGSKKLTSALGDNIVIADNLAADYFTIQYTGEEASCLMDVTGGSITVKAGDLESEETIYTCDLTVYNTVEKVVDFFDSKPDLDAAAGAKFKTKPTANAFDYVTDADIASAEYAVTANLQAIVDFVNSLAEPYMAAYRPVEAGEVPKNADYQFLAGGSATAPTTTDWGDAFNLLQTKDVQCVVPLTSDASIHAQADAHCIYMSNSAGMERRCIVGGALGETQAEAVQRAYDLNSDRAYICYPGVKDYDETGVLTTLAPYFSAAMLGGMICGADPGTSLTNKTLTIRGIEQEMRIPTDTDELINAGVIVIAPTTKGYKCIRSISTWLPNDNYNRVEMGTGFAVDYVARNVRNALEDLIGRKGTPAVLAEAVSRTESQLKELSRPAPLGPEVIVGDAENPAYKNITATLEGDVLRVYFECSPVIPVNYIPVGIAIVPYSGSATA